MHNNVNFLVNYTEPNLSVNFAVNSIGIPLNIAPLPPSEVICALATAHGLFSWRC